MIFFKYFLLILTQVGFALSNENDDLYVDIEFDRAEPTHSISDFKENSQNPDENLINAIVEISSKVKGLFISENNYTNISSQIDNGELIGADIELSFNYKSMLNGTTDNQTTTTPVYEETTHLEAFQEKNDNITAEISFILNLNKSSDNDSTQINSKIITTTPSLNETSDKNEDSQLTETSVESINFTEKYEELTTYSSTLASTTTSDKNETQLNGLDSIQNYSKYEIQLTTVTIPFQEYTVPEDTSAANSIPISNEITDLTQETTKSYLTTEKSQTVVSSTDELASETKNLENLTKTIDLNENVGLLKLPDINTALGTFSFERETTTLPYEKPFTEPITSSPIEISIESTLLTTSSTTTKMNLTTTTTIASVPNEKITHQNATLLTRIEVEKHYHSFLNLGKLKI